jgi:chromosomal replication initiation ATPase DnaA
MRNVTQPPLPRQPESFRGSGCSSILGQVAAKHGIQLFELYGRMTPTGRRKRVLARWEAMTRLHDELHMSLPAIARELGLTNHTTVLHGIRMFRKSQSPVTPSYIEAGLFQHLAEGVTS